MRREALSVMNNISEGFERRTPKDFAHFLDLAKGSAGEVRSMTYAAEDLKILRSDIALDLRADYETTKPFQNALPPSKSTCVKSRKV